MAEGITGDSKGITRRGAAKTVATFAAGAVAGAVASKVPEFLRKEDRSLVDALKNFTLVDFADPKGEKLQKLVDASASEFIRVLQPQGVKEEDLKQRLKLHVTEPQYKESVEKSGGVVAPVDGGISYGVYVNKTREVHLNLQGLRKRAEQLSDQPGVVLYRWLAHEWFHSLREERTTGTYLNSPKEVITDSNGLNPEQWGRYRGGMIITQNHAALGLFDESWNDAVTKYLVTESLKRDPKLLDSATSFIADSPYWEGATRFGKLAQRAGLDAKELTRLYQSSDLETLFNKIGSTFREEAISEVRGLQRGNRDDAQMKQEKNFLLGKRVAFLTQYGDWPEYNSMMSYIEPISAATQKR